MLNQIQNLLDDLRTETDSVKILQKKYELAQLTNKFVFDKEPEEVLIKALVDRDELDLLFYEVSQTANFLKNFITNNIEYIEEALGGEHFSKTLQENQKELLLAIERLKELKEERRQAREYEKEILQNKSEIENLEKEIDQLNTFLKQYEDKDLDSLQKEFKELNQVFLDKYHKSFEETKQELESWEARIEAIRKHAASYEQTKQELDKVEKEFTDIEEKYNKQQQLLQVYKEHFDANLRLKYDRARGIEKTIEEGLKDLDEHIRESMMAIKRTQDAILEKQK